MALITATSTNNWATAFPSLPTAGDDVVIPATFTVTIPASYTAACRSLSLTGTGSLTTAATTSVINIGDATAGLANVALSISATSTITLTGIGQINFISTSVTQQTITTNGKIPPSLNINGVGSSYLMSDALTVGTFTHTNGTFDTGSFNFTPTVFQSNAGTKTITLGSSAISCNNWTLRSLNTTVTANTATITQPSSSASFDFNSLAGCNYNGLTLIQSGSGNASIGTASSGAVTVGTYTRTGTAVKNDTLIIGASSLTVTGTATFDGNSTVNRLYVKSSIDGTSRTITAATVVSSYSDWSDITGAGVGSWNLASITGGSGDALGNSGLTFTTAVDRYAMVAGNADSTAMWSATNGGSTGASIPLPQDDIYFTSSAGAGTYVMNMPRQGKNWNCTGFTRTLQVSTQVWNIYGNVTLGAAGTYSNVVSGSHSFVGRGSHTITSNGSVFAGASGVPTVSINGFGGTYTLQDAMTHSTGTISVLQGTFDTNNFSLTAVTPSVTGSLVRTVNLGTSTVTVTGASSTQWNATTVSNLTFNALSSTINIATASASAKSFVGGGLKYGTLNYTLAGSTGTFTITGNNYFGTINFSDASNARSLLLTSGTNTTVENFNVNGTSGKLMSVNAVTAGTPAYLDIIGAPPTVDYLSVKDIYAGIPFKFYAGVNSTNTSGNTNIAFTAKPSPDGIYVNRYSSIVSTTTSGIVTLPWSLTPVSGNVLVAFWHHNGNAGTVTPPAGWTAIDAINYSTTSYLKAYYKISDGSETSFTFTSTSSPSSTQIHVYSLAGFTGTGTLDVFDKNSDTAITSLVTSGTPSSNTGNPAFAIAGFGGANTMGNSVSFTNSFLEGRGVTQQTMNRPVMKPLTSNGAVSTTYGWTTSRDATTILAVFKDVVISGTDYDITKTATYAVSAPLDITKSAQYCVISDVDQTKSSQYQVATDTDVTLGASYAVQLSSDVTKSGDYAVATTTDITQGSSYSVIALTDLTKSAQYAVITSQDITLGNQYAVSTDTTLTLSASYVPITAYDIAKVGQYAVSAVISTTLPSGYAVATTTDITKSVDYDVALSSDLTKSADYAVLATQDVTLEATYALGTVPTVTLPTDYEVLSISSIQKTAEYGVIVTRTITKTAQYMVFESYEDGTNEYYMPMYSQGRIVIISSNKDFIISL